MGARRTQIAAEKESALRDVRKEVALLSVSVAEKVLMKTAGWIFGDAHRFEAIELGARGAGVVLHGKPLGPMGIPIAKRWLRYRDIDEVPTESFRSWFKKNRKEDMR